jgi:hypothetical protein
MLACQSIYCKQLSSANAVLGIRLQLAVASSRLVMLEPLCAALTFDQCVESLARALKVDMQPRSHDERLLLVHYFAALVIDRRLPASSHDGMGNTALHYAARVGWSAGVSSIIGSGAFRDACAAADDSEENRQQHAAAAVMTRNAGGCSALHCACVSGSLRTLHALMQAAGTAHDLDHDDDDAGGPGNEGGGHARTSVDCENRTLLHYAGDPHLIAKLPVDHSHPAHHTLTPLPSPPYRHFFSRSVGRQRENMCSSPQPAPSVALSTRCQWTHAPSPGTAARQHSISVLHRHACSCHRHDRLSWAQPRRHRRRDHSLALQRSVHSRLHLS